MHFFIFSNRTIMKKRFIFKWVSVLGAILLLANVVLPWINAYAYSDDTWTWDYVYDEDSWNSSKASWALKVYYANNPSEDLWCGDSTNGHKASWDDVEYSAEICSDSQCIESTNANLTTIHGNNYQLVSDWSNSYYLTNDAVVGNDEIYPLYTSINHCSLLDEDLPEWATIPQSWLDEWLCQYMHDAVVINNECTLPDDHPDGAEVNPYASADWCVYNVYGEIVPEPSNNYVKLISSSYPNCTPSYQGRIANGAVSPWISVAFKKEFNWTIKFNYSDYQNGADVYPREQTIRNWWPEWKVWAVASMPGEFPGIESFGIDKFSATLVSALTVSTASIKAAKYIESKDENWWREKRNLDGSKFSISNAYDEDSRTLTVTITDNWLETYVWGNSETAKKWIWLIADFWTVVNGSVASEWIEGYGIEQWDRDDAHIYDWNESSNTDFIIWINREDKDWKTIRFQNSVDADDYVNVKFVFKNKQQSSGGSSWGSTSSSNTWTNNTWATAESGTTADTWANTPTVNPQGVAANGYTNEMNEAYEFAYANGITTMKSIDEAEMLDGLTRIAMAKMLSQYAINVLGKSPADVEVPNFTDVSADLDAEYANGVTLAYKLGIMWINMPDNKFLPYETVTRAQFGTALSRLLFGIEDGEDAYYTTHLAKLKEAWIITNDDPTLEELRGYVMLMLMRSSK